MNKFLCTFALLTISINFSLAQSENWRFQTHVSVGTAVVQNKVGKSVGQSNVEYVKSGYWGLCLNLRAGIAFTEDHAVFFTTYIDALFPFDGTGSGLFSPVLIQYNYGSGSTYGSEKKIGFFVAGGYNFGSMNDYKFDGLCVLGGINFGVEHSFGIRFQFIRAKPDPYDIKPNNIEPAKAFLLGAIYHIPILGRNKGGYQPG